MRLRAITIASATLAAVSLFAAPAGAAVPGQAPIDLSRQFVETSQVNTCNNENIRGNVILQVVTKSNPDGTFAQHSYTHGILTGDQGHRYVVNHHQDARTTGVDFLLSVRVILASQGSVPNQILVIEVNTATGVFTTQFICVG